MQKLSPLFSLISRPVISISDFGFCCGGRKRNPTHYIEMSIIEGIELRLSTPQQNLKSEMFISPTYIALNQLISIINHLSLFEVIACSTLKLVSPLSR